MSNEYSSQQDYLRRIQEDVTARHLNVEEGLRKAFAAFIEIREVEVVVFSGMSVYELRDAIRAQPIILKALLACCNVAGRALARDLGMTVDTYSPRMSEADRS